MNEPIRITKKRAKKGDDGYKIVSVRMRDERAKAEILSVQKEGNDG